jgi:hypothetical protein
VLQADVLKAEAVRAREEEERGNAMKALENRTKDSKREMDIMEALDEMKSLKARYGARPGGGGGGHSTQGQQWRGACAQGHRTSRVVQCSVASSRLPVGQ